MHLVAAARLRPGLLAHRVDRLRVQLAEIVGTLRILVAATVHRLGAPLFQRRVVEKGIGPRVQRLGRQRRGRGQFARQHAHLAGLDAAQQLQPAVAVHRLVQAVAQGLRHQRVLGNLALADQVLRAGHLVGKHRGQQILGLHPLQLRRDLAPAGEARQRQRIGGVPAPAHAEQRRVQQRLYQHVQRRRGAQIACHLVQGEAVPGRQRQHDRVLGRGRLQLEIEGAAEALAQGQAPGAVDAAAVDAVDHQLGAAGGIEEAFQHDALLGRQGAQRRMRAAQVIDDLLRGGGVQRQRAAQPLQRLRRAALLQRLRDFGPQPRHAQRQRVAAPGRLADPERDVGRCAARVLHPHPPRFHAQDAVAGVAELEHVATQALHREILVDRADGLRLRLQHHAVVAGLGDGAAGGERRHPRAAALAHAAMHRIAMQVTGARPQPRAEAFAEHAQHRVELRARQRRIRPGATHQRVQRVFLPLLAGHLGDELLGEHVQRRIEHAQRIQFAAAHAIQQGRALDQVVARLRKQARLRRAAHRVAGAAGALQERGDRTRRAELADQVDVADVQAQFQRGGGHQHLQLAGLEPALGEQPGLARQAAVMRRHRLRAEQFAQVPRGALGHAPGVDEHQGGAVRAHQLGQARIRLLPLVGGHGHAERRRRHLQRQVAGTRIADVDDGAVGNAVVHRGAADQETRDRLDRLLRRRQADAQRRHLAQLLQALQRQRQMAAALVRRQRVDLVDDHRAHVAQRLAPGHRAEQHVQRLRRGHQHMRRAPPRLRALALWGVAGAYRGANGHIRQTQRRQFGANALQRRLEIELDVV
ncbi:hypothetical protein NB717_002239 [Xanthomonas sacchari]|nr:hypothetical protein [Xanthomonas sacchari]